MDRYIAIVEGIEYGISMNPHSNNDKWYLWKSHILSTSGWLCVYLYTVWVYIYMYIYDTTYMYIYILWISNTFLLWCSLEATMCTPCELIFRRRVCCGQLGWNEGGEYLLSHRRLPWPAFGKLWLLGFRLSRSWVVKRCGRLPFAIGCGSLAFGLLVVNQSHW